MEVKAMKSRRIGLLVFLSFTAIFSSFAVTSFPGFGGSSAWGAEDDLPFPKNATVTTLITTPRLIEGLTGDNQNNLYTGGWGTLRALFGKLTSTSLASFQLDSYNPRRTVFSWEVHLTRSATFSWLTMSESSTRLPQTARVRLTP